MRVGSEPIDNIVSYVGRPFDVRLTFDTFYPGILRTDIGVVEELDFSHDIPIEEVRYTTLIVTRDCRIDGLVFGIELQAEEDGEKLNTLTERSRWENVYIPLFDHPKDVHKGDSLAIEFKRSLAKDKIHHNYDVKLSVDGGTTVVTFRSNHFGRRFRQNKLYSKLFVPI